VYAVIEDRGTQIKVAAGDVIDIDLIPGSSDKKQLTFDRVLLVGNQGDKKPAAVGAPYLEGATVEAEVVGPVTGEKLEVLMYKRRKGQRRKMGHRQGYLRIKITEINAK
jgi:large subunit ribosomal protein L21